MSEKPPKLLDIDSSMPEEVEKHAKQRFEGHCMAVSNVARDWEELPSDLKNRWRLRAFIERKLNGD